MGYEDSKEIPLPTSWSRLIRSSPPGALFSIPASMLANVPILF
jgi:hypothetical protein